MITMEAHDEKCNIAGVTCEGMRTIEDMIDQGNSINPWVRK